MLRQYFWFCLEHVRAYNKAWDYFKGMSSREIEASIRSDTTWNNETRPLGIWRDREERLKAAAAGFCDGWDQEAPHRHNQSRRPLTDEEQALALMALQPPVDFAAIKTRYYELVKVLHPDANGGDLDAEERLKEINRAFTLLKSSYIPVA